MERIGILGGTFNPPHIGHIVCASAAYEQLELDRVILIPVGVPPHKEIVSDPGRAARFEMCQLAVKDDPRFAVSRIEIDRSGPSYSVVTLEALKLENPEGELSFIVGSDIAVNLPRWHQPQRVVQLAEFAVADRDEVPRSEVERAFESLGASERLKFFEMPTIDISSTRVRELVYEGKQIDDFVPKKVVEYIERAGLYRQG